jgi:hypothetical protein
VSKLQFKIEFRQARFLEDGRDAEMGPKYFNDRVIRVYAKDEAKAVAKAESIYGHKEEIDANGQYVTDETGAWTEMNVISVTEES